MADFVAVLKKAIDGLSDNTPEMREKVYRKARETISAKLAAIDPPPSRIVVERQHKALDDAIAATEATYASKEASFDDFESVLAGIEEEPFEPATAGPVFTNIRPAAAPAADLAPLAAQPPEALQSASEPSTGLEEHAPDDDALKPIAPAPRPEPVLARPPLAGDGVPATEAPLPVDNNRRRLSGGIIAALVVLLVVAAGGYGVWLNRGEFATMLGFGGGTVVEEASAPEAAPAEESQAEAPASEEPAAEPEPELASAPVEPPAEPAADEASPDAQPADEVVKFTQRLTADGQEIDEGPAGGEASIGEGTSLAEATQVAQADAGEQAAAPASADTAPAEPTAEGEQALPVGQRAIFYEERTNVAQGSAENGATVWSLVQESPGGDLPPEPAIRAEVSIPGKDIQLRMTIRRNGDATLPASHIVEMIFLTSGTFEGGGIDSVLRIALKGSEAAPGTPLIGMPARIADGYFLVALNNDETALEQNTQLLARQSWIDIPIVYRSGRRALVTMEKGVPGDRVFQEAMQAWRNASSG